MRVLALACTLSLFACSSAAEDDGPPPPEVAAKPAGTGWACFRNRLVDTASICTRPSDCETARRVFAAEMDRSGDPYDLSSCADRPQASCVTFKPATSPQYVYVCMELASECESARAFYESHATDYSHVSACGIW